MMEPVMSQPLLILHLSDLHFGPHGRFEGEDLDALARRFHQAIDEARSELGWKEQVGLCIVTGDIAEAARPKEYKRALTFFEALVGTLGLARTRFIFTSGNHDVSWAITRKIEIDRGDEDFDAAELERRIQQHKFDHFENFLREFYGKGRAELSNVLNLGYGAYLHNFPHEQLTVAALNSCERESHRHQGGFLSPEQAQALMSQWHASEARSWLKVAAVHHNPVATVSENVWPWVDELQKKAKAGEGKAVEDWIEHFTADTCGFKGNENLCNVAMDCQVQLVLHGHHHAEKAVQWPWGNERGHALVLSTGSWGLRSDKLPENQPNRMHLLRIDLDKEELRAVARVYEPRVRAEGHVKPGHFAVDAGKPKGSRYTLIPPEGLKSVQSASPTGNLGADKVQGFIDEYKKRLAKRYQRWDLGSVGAVQSGGAGRPVDATLDDMYLPLRLAKGYDPQELDAGHPLGPEALLARQTPLILRGAAGRGKTTWMRWTFRQLASGRIPTAMPFMIELRKLASIWHELRAQGETQTMDAYLRIIVREAEVEGWKEVLPHVLKSETGPRPVLLVDGWDELGPLGDELRDKLNEFLAAYPRVLAVVSSRPYGQSQPSHGDGFEVLDIQPLSDEEISRFVSNFHLHVYGEDEETARASTQRIRDSLKASHEAQSFARIPLLLTMMLLISRDRPLPDKRHKLYEECIRNLLSARPEQREREGARLQAHQWRPTDSEERLRAVAALAAQVQQEGYKRSSRAPIVRSGEELEVMLPKGWTRDERRGFLAWLVGAAGVMTEQADGTLSFTHLSFQEYLTAHHLDANNEGSKERLQLCWERMRDRAWWETLRLWAAIVSARNPAHLTPLLQGLIESESPVGYWLAGAIFADGTGADDIFAIWKDRLPQKLLAGDIDSADANALVWAASRQEPRRRMIEEFLAGETTERTWLQVVRFDHWQETASIGERARDQSAQEQLIAHATSGQGVARARILWGAHPAWPLSPGVFALLRLFPTPRRTSSARLQLLLTFGPPETEFRLAARKLLAVPSGGIEILDSTRDFVRDLAQNLARDFTRDFAQDFAKDLVQDWTRDWVWHWTRELARSWERYWVRDWGRDLAQGLEEDWVRELAQGFTQSLARGFARDLARDLARYWARNWGFDRVPEWLVDFAMVEIASSTGRSGTRTVFAHRSDMDDPPFQILKAACQSSVAPTAPGTALKEALARYPADGEPLWPALARHLARCSTAQDRALLSDLAQHPEKRGPPLSDALKYYVRGDLVFNDGREMTLDALCDELGLPRLPYLEDMPPELEVDWD
jgi:3',5'-cyclic AMP phosphodiesterase CpdA